MCMDMSAATNLRTLPKDFYFFLSKNVVFVKEFKLKCVHSVYENGNNKKR